MPVRRIKKFLSKKTATWYLVIGLILLIVTGAYAIHYYRNPAHYIPARASRNVAAIQDWMTIHYVARIYAVPEQILLDAVGVSQQQASHQSIKAIARSQQKTVNQLLTSIRTTVQQYQGLP